MTGETEGSKEDEIAVEGTMSYQPVNGRTVQPSNSTRRLSERQLVANTMTSGLFH